MHKELLGGITDIINLIGSMAFFLIAVIGHTTGRLPVAEASFYLILSVSLRLISGVRTSD